MNRGLCCSYFFKVIICLFIIGMIITFINIGNNDIEIINTRTFSVSVANGTEVEIGPRQYRDSEYHFTFQYVDIIHIKSEFDNGLQSQSISRLYYNETNPMGQYFNLYEKLYLSYIIFTFILFIVVMGTFFIPPKNKMEKHSKSMYHYRCLWYSLLVMTYLPMFILMMFMVTRDLRESLKEESKINPIIKEICLDKDGNDFGYCEKNDYTTKSIDQEYIKDYNVFLNNNKTIFGYEKYTWGDGKMEIKMIISFFQVMKYNSILKIMTDRRKVKLKINILPKLILSIILLALLATFITIEPVKVLELSTKTFKSKYLNGYGEILESRIYQSNKYEFSFEFVDILDLSTENKNGTININRIQYEKNSSLYSFFNRFAIYYKIYLSFIVMLFLSVLISFFFPYSNDIFKDSQSRKVKKTILFSSFFLFYLPIFVTMILLITLDFKKAIRNDSKHIQELNKICFGKENEYFGFCNSIGLSDYRNNLSLNDLSKETYIKNNTIYGWEQYKWEISLINIKMIFSYFFVFITFAFLIYIVFYNTIKGHEFKKDKKNNNEMNLNEMIDLQISKNSLGNSIANQQSEPSSSNKSFKNTSCDSLNNSKNIIENLNYTDASSSTNSISSLINSNNSVINK